MISGVITVPETWTPREEGEMQKLVHEAGLPSSVQLLRQTEAAIMPSLIRDESQIALQDLIRDIPQAQMQSLIGLERRRSLTTVKNVHAL